MKSSSSDDGRNRQRYGSMGGGGAAAVAVNDRGDEGGGATEQAKDVLTWLLVSSTTFVLLFLLVFALLVAPPPPPTTTSGADRPNAGAVADAAAASRRNDAAAISSASVPRAELLHVQHTSPADYYYSHHHHHRTSSPNVVADQRKAAESAVTDVAAAAADNDDGMIVLRGFKNNLYDAESNPAGKLRWYCAPDSWTTDDVDKVSPGNREGRDGSWSIGDDDDGSDDSDNYTYLILTPPAKKDFWRKTYYDPILIKDDGPILYAELDYLNDASTKYYYTVETSFVLTAVRQFDQAGLMIRLGPEHWIKTGIEVVDKKPRLSVVVTNVYSDWSTQAWSDFTPADDHRTSVHVKCNIRVHCRGTSFVVESRMRPNGEWQFVRIAHLSRCMECRNDPLGDYPSGWTGAAPAPGKIWAGVFAASPEDQRGGHAKFTTLDIRRGSHFAHNADGNQDS